MDEALLATWPAAAETRLGPVTLRAGAGGGKRVSAATVEGPADAAAVAAAEAAMRAEGRAPLFRVGRDQPGLDAILATRGYDLLDPTVYYAAPVAQVARPPRAMSLFPIWPPLAIQAQIWAESGIGPARLAVMARAPGPKCSFVARIDNRAAGVGFCALHGPIAMLHALEVVPEFRRRGTGRLLVTGIAHWAQGQGAETFALAVTQGNLAARALYEGLGMQEAGGYHYREARP